MKYEIREFRARDEAMINEVALAAFEEYRDHYEDWEVFTGVVGTMSSLSENGELIVATVQGQVAGAVVYVGPGKKKGSVRVSC